MRYHHRATLIKSPGSPSESREEVLGEIQPETGFFPVRTPIEEGDVVEVPDSRRDRTVLRYSVAEVKVYQGHGSLDHLEVTWSEPTRTTPARPRVPAIGDLHDVVVEVSGALYADQHYASAVFEAFKGLEVRVRHLSGVDENGSKLMGRVFGGDSPMLRLSSRPGIMGTDEHNGRMLILMGSMQAIRNLGGHELEGVDSASAIELLGLASQAMRWLDEVEAGLSSSGA